MDARKWARHHHQNLQKAPATALGLSSPSSRSPTCWNSPHKLQQTLTLSTGKRQKRRPQQECERRPACRSSQAGGGTDWKRQLAPLQPRLRKTDDCLCRARPSPASLARRDPLVSSTGAWRARWRSRRARAASPCWSSCWRFHSRRSKTILSARGSATSRRWGRPSSWGWCTLPCADDLTVAWSPAKESLSCCS